MKRIYEVGTIQYFTYTIPALFKRNRIVEDHWVIRNVKCIYADNEEEAREKYKKWFYKEHSKVTYGWRDWYLESPDTDIDMEEEWIDITSTEIIVLDNQCFSRNFDVLKENMQAEDFKEWWFDNGRCNRIPE